LFLCICFNSQQEQAYEQKGLIEFMELSSQTIWGNTIAVWLTALGVFAASYIGLQILKRILVRPVAALASRTAVEVDDLVAGLLKGTKTFFVVALSLYFGSLALDLPERITEIAGIVTVILALAQVGYWGNAVISFFVERKVREQVEQEDTGSATVMNALGFVGKMILWSLLLLLALDNAGVEITSLVASLGIGGVAVALAVQNILGDLFASLSIVLDQPFAIGDFIVVGEYMGTVEDIGLKSTRVRSLTGEELVFSNSDLLGSRIRNYKSLARRRASFSISIVYGTPYEKVEAVPELLAEIVKAQKDVTFDRAHLKEYGDFALIYEVVYYFETADYNAFMDTQQAINLAIYQKFEQEGIAFAFPTPTIHLQQLKE
jgi:small-conductance mechanosensitive channel